MTFGLDEHGLDEHKSELITWFSTLQGEICRTLESFESGISFTSQEWPYKAGQGGGRSCVLRGKVLEKAGVSVSCIQGTCSPSMAKELEFEPNQCPSFWASGISVIVHPMHPHMPAVHFNTRCFVMENCYWFGGGTDLTPMLHTRRTQEDPDTHFFHQALQQVCQEHYNYDVYTRYKKQCDDYFYLPHRQEPRGIGGIFYDKLATNWDSDAAFTRALGKTFLTIYQALLMRNQTIGWGAQERDEQLWQRSRYVEFNLLYDRGTHFGLKSGGNIDAIFSSMPPVACW